MLRSVTDLFFVCITLIIWINHLTPQIYQGTSWGVLTNRLETTALWPEIIGSVSLELNTLVSFNHYTEGQQVVSALCDGLILIFKGCRQAGCCRTACLSTPFGVFCWLAYRRHQKSKSEHGLFNSTQTLLHSVIKMGCKKTTSHRGKAYGQIQIFLLVVNWSYLSQQGSGKI